MLKTLIISAHLDDAALCCTDHVLSWKKAGRQLKIVTIFTKFGQRTQVKLLKKRLVKVGFQDPTRQEEIRKKEDFSAMDALGVAREHMNFVDACYRVNKGSLVYRRYKSVFEGKISHADYKLTEEVKTRLQEFEDFDQVIIPLGIGRHVDHIIARSAAEEIFPRPKISYYIDYPYALKISNWNLPNLIKFLIYRKSVKKMTEKKLKTLYLYKSQMPLLFKGKPSYPEIILSNS